MPWNKSFWFRFVNIIRVVNVLWCIM
jgi:hypothetical protein